MNILTPWGMAAAVCASRTDADPDADPDLCVYAVETVLSHHVG